MGHCSGFANKDEIRLTLDLVDGGIYYIGAIQGLTKWPTSRLVEA